MPQSKTRIVGGLSALAVAVATAVVATTHAGNGVAQDQSQTPSEQAATQPVASASSTDAQVEHWLSLLEENRQDLLAQQEQERTEAAAVLELPPETSFGAPQNFPELDLQIAALESGEVLTAEEAPQSAWYEDGYFASQMAIDWRCAWLSQGVQSLAGGDTDGVRNAVDTLHAFESLKYAAAFPDYDYFLRTHVDPLLEGDPAGAEDYLSLCLDVTLVR